MDPSENEFDTQEYRVSLYSGISKMHIFFKNFYLRYGADLPALWG